MTSLFHISLFLASIQLITDATQPTIIDLTSSNIETRIAVQICSGLYNRIPDNNGVYTLMSEPYDTDWLKDLYNISNPILTPINDFMIECLSTKNIAKGYIRYNYTLQHLITPNLITMASILNAVLLEDGSPYIINNTLLFDAIVEFRHYTALEATKYMYNHYINSTTTLAFMDASPCNPGLIDYIIKEKIFNLYLSNACIRGTPEYEFFDFMVNPINNPWNNPINVMGYNDAWPVAGDLFEAETDCNALHNMGQVASDGFNNLAFFSRTNNITKPLIQNPSKYIKLNKSKIYISFTIGDGDNLSYIKGSRRNWMLDRINRCVTSNYSYLGCFPLQWSISPHLIYLAPKIINWYYSQSYITGLDYFVLPPSGHLYSYPSEMDYNTTQKNFIKWTENDCKILGCNASVAWEFVFRWFNAIKNYFPRYVNNDIIKGLFAVNVPYNVPVYDFWLNDTTPKLEFYKIYDGKIVLFKPSEWRGYNHTRCKDAPLDYWNCLTVNQMADEINDFYPLSTITQIYVTSDGGANLQMIYDLVPKLKEYVQIVSPTQLIDLALQRG
eukprot:548182_1